MASSIVIAQTTPTEHTLVDGAYPEPDYRDGYLIPGRHWTSVDAFATDYFLAQPGWLAVVSMNLRGRKAVSTAVAATSYADGTAVGSWTVHGRTENEIMFGQHMGFMEYRFSFLRHDDGTIETSTTVKYLNRLGPVYFTIVKPFHVQFVKLALRNAARRHHRPSLAPA